MKKIAALKDRQRLQENVRKLEQTLAGPIGTDAATYASQRRVSRPALQQRLEHAKKTLERVSPPKLLDSQRVKLEKRKEKLETEISENMLPYDTTLGERAGAGRAPYSGAIGQELTFEENFGPKMKELKNICRALYPENPDLPNLERLRPIHRSGDPTGSKVSVINAGIPE